MKKYNSFILEDLKTFSKENAKDYLEKLIGFNSNNAIFYRSDEKLGDDVYLLKTQERESRTKNNLQNLILSQYDYMPDRTRSISFSTLNVVESFGEEFNVFSNTIYHLIPENNVKIAICPSTDINKYPSYKIVKEFFKLDFAKSYEIEYGQFHFFEVLRKSLNRLTKDIFEYNLMKIPRKDRVKYFKDYCVSIEMILRDLDLELYTDICHPEFFDLFYKPFIDSNKSFYEYILETFDPIANGFKVVDFNWDKMEDESFREQFENKECYFDGTCLLIKANQTLK
jgi:hypothetical protein